MENQEEEKESEEQFNREERTYHDLRLRRQQLMDSPEFQEHLQSLHVSVEEVAAYRNAPKSEQCGVTQRNDLPAPPPEALTQMQSVAHLNRASPQVEYRCPADDPRNQASPWPGSEVKAPPLSVWGRIKLKLFGPQSTKKQ